MDEGLSYRTDLPDPRPGEGEALVRVAVAGVCNTDLELVRGYMSFRGIPGHEFAGVVEEAAAAPHLVGCRVVGEINAPCGTCPVCRAGRPTHCPNRTTLGIAGRDGAFAERLALPASNLHTVPDSVSDEEAVFAEPLAAACEILQQVHVRPTDRVVVLGDGKLGLLCAQVLQLTGCELNVVGRHVEKLGILGRRGIPVTTDPTGVEPGADIVVEATGDPDGFALARKLVRPRGVVVLKSTYHGDVRVSLTMAVVDEVALVGSRCGPFPPALRLLRDRLVDVAPLVGETLPLSMGIHAFSRAGSPGALKVLLRMAFG